jgi:hypothetical protein
MNYLLYPILAVAVSVGIAVGLWQIYVIFTIIYPEWGVPGLVAAYLFFPLTLMLIPFYSGLVLGDWSYMLFYPAGIAVLTVGGAAWALLQRDALYD